MLAIPTSPEMNDFIANMIENEVRMLLFFQAYINYTILKKIENLTLIKRVIN